MSVISSLILSMLYIVYILLWFIGCGFVTMAFLEYTTTRKKEHETNSSQLWDAVLVISIYIVCFSGLIGRSLSIFSIIDKIKDLWR